MPDLREKVALTPQSRRNARERLEAHIRGLHDYTKAQSALRLVDIICADRDAILEALEVGWRNIESAPRDGTMFLATVRVFSDGVFSHQDTHIVLCDDETGEIHPDYDQGWRLEDYDFWTALPTPPEVKS